nr:uncharacterized protein LOC129272551 [Lytechinus pictus]
MWVSGSKTEKYRATVLAVNRSKDNLIRKRNKMCDGQSMETDKETGRGKRKKKPTRTYMYSSSELETDDEEPQPKETKKSKSKISQCNEMARDLRKQMFGANETVCAAI